MVDLNSPTLLSKVTQMVKNLLQSRRPGFNPLDKGMATHSSILAWEILCTEESGGLPSMGSQE